MISPFYSNCLLTLLLLYYRGKVERVFRFPGTSHWMGITPRGNLIHFKALSPGDLRWWKPFFMGKLVVRKYIPSPRLPIEVVYGGNVRCV